MDLCVFDWKAITPICAALIASCTALYISNKWNNQKGSEVIANEAKSMIIKISRLQSLQGDIIKKILCTRQISQNPYPIRILPS